MKTTNRPLLPFSALLAMLAGCLPLGAVVITGENSTDAYDRFSSGYPSSPVENSNFFRNPDEFHGVGWNKANANQSFALITPQHIVGANHFNPGAGSTVQFFTTGGSVTEISILSTSTVQNGGNPTDVFIGELSSPLNSGDVPRFLFPSDAVIASLVGRSIVPYGFTAEAGNNTVSSRDGITTASGALGGGSNLANTPTFEFTLTDTTASNGDARLEGGDSGSPTFLEENGVLTLVGTHSALATSTTGPSTTYVSADADLTRLMDQINTTIDDMGNTGFQVAQIPEPGTFSLIAMGICSATVFSARRERRK